MSKAMLVSIPHEACWPQPVVCTQLTDELRVMLQSCDWILLCFFACMKLRNADPKSVWSFLTFLVVGFCWFATQITFLGCKASQPLTWEDLRQRSQCDGLCALYPHHLLTGTRLLCLLPCRTEAIRPETHMDPKQTNEPQSKLSEVNEFFFFLEMVTGEGSGTLFKREWHCVVHSADHSQLFLLTIIWYSSHCWLTWGHLLACLMIKKIRMALEIIDTLGT